MGQHKQPCPLCARAPGTRHLPTCTRSQGSRARQAADLHRAGSGRWIHLFGPQVVKEPGKAPREVTNYGIPYTGPDKPWNAGGVPRIDVEDLEEAALRAAEEQA